MDWFLDTYLVPLFGTFLPDSSISLTFCIDVCKLDKTGTSPSRPGLIQEKIFTNQSSQRFCPPPPKSFPLQEEAGSCGHVLFTLCWSSGWGPMASTCPNHHLCSPQVSRFCHIYQSSKMPVQMQASRQFFGQLWRNWDTGHLDQPFPSQGKSWELEVFIFSFFAKQRKGWSMTSTSPSNHLYSTLSG